MNCLDPQTKIQLILPFMLLKMIKSSSRKLRRSLSEPCIPITSSTQKRPTIDPFKQLSKKQTKTPILKPACHKKSYSENILIPQKVPNSAKKTGIMNLMTASIHTKYSKKPIHHPKLRSAVFADKNFPFTVQTINPSFSAKTSERSTNDDVKPVYRTKRNNLTQPKHKIKVPSVNKKMIKKVNLLFQEKSLKNKSALDFSFADRDSLIIDF